MNPDLRLINRAEFTHLKHERERLLDRAKSYNDWPASRSCFLETIERLIESVKYCERTLSEVKATHG